MTVDQAVKAANLLEELYAIEALEGEIEFFLSKKGFECVPTELCESLIALVRKAYEDKEKEIEAL